MRIHYQPVMVRRAVRLVTLLALLATAMGQSPSEPARAALVSPAEMLNDNGTLDLASGYQGSLDLAGWDVRLDSQLGPVFSKAGAPLAEPGGSWSWPAAGGFNATVYALSASGTGSVYVGGSFTDGGGDVDCDRICLWNGSTWSWPGGAGAGGLNGEVHSIEPNGTGGYYVGGGFTDAGGDTDADRIALWSGGVWSWPGTGGLSGTVLAIEFVDSSTVYAGGSFLNAGGDVEADNIALWNETADTWSWPSAGGINGTVLALESGGTDILYVGGFFGDTGGDADADNIAYWNESTDAWSWPTGMGLSDEVTTLVFVAPSSLFVGGVFTDAGGDTDGDRIALWNELLNTWSWPTGMGLNDTVNSLAWDGATSTLYLGGWFTDAGGDPDADRIALRDGTTLRWPGGLGAGGLNGPTYALTLDSSGLYAGGTFTDAGGDTDADRIALFTFAASVPLFEDGFESGDTSAWSGVNNGNGNLTVDTPCAMEGTYGMCVVSTNNKRKQVIDSVPNDETRYYASFLLDHNDVTISGASNRIRIFQGRMDANFPFIVLLRYTGGGLRQVSLRMQTDAGPGNFIDSAWYTITNGVHTIGVDWRQSSGGNDGWGDLYVDGALQGSGHTVDLVDNDTLVIHGTRLGITSRMDGVTMTGTLYMDDFYSDVNGYPE